MEKKEVLFSNYKIPEAMLPFIKVQDSLSVLCDENLNDVKKIFLESVTSKQFYEEAIINILRFAKIRTENLRCYAELCKSLVSEFGTEFREQLLCNARGLLLRELYKIELFTLDEIKEICEDNISQYFYFAPELDIPKEAEEIRLFGQVYSRLNILRKDGWALYKDLLKCGYEKNTLRYALRYDDLDFLKEATQANDWTYSKRLFASPFDPGPTLSLLSFVGRYGSIKCFKFLLEKGLKIDQETTDAVIASGSEELFELLRENTKTFRRSLVTAAQYYRMDFADWLLANADTSDVFLDNLIEVGNYRIAIYFASPSDIVYSIGTWTPLSRAAFNGFLSMCMFFVANGAVSNPTKQDTLTPLHAAVLSGYSEVCKYIISIGVNINPTDDNHNTPLYLAAQKNNTKAVELLIKNGAEIDFENEEKKTALIAASENNACGAARLLLDSGANVNLIDEYNRTAVHYAAENNNAEIIRMLVDKGAATDIKDDEGMNPFDLCETRAAMSALKGEPEPSGWLSWLCRI
jgi:ankyrin repeat protein